MDDNRGLWVLVAGFFVLTGMVAATVQAAMALLRITTVGITVLGITDPLNAAFIVVYLVASIGFWYAVFRFFGWHRGFEFDRI